MAWWGTMVGGALGFMLGGPLGALLGAALGRNFDKGITLNDGAGFDLGDQQRVQAAFFTASFSIMGHIAKADGRVTPDEISSCENIMNHMQLDADQRKAAIRLFNEGKNPDFPLHDVLAQLRRECHRRHNLLRFFLEIQIATAMADGELHPQERTIIYTIGDELGFRRIEIDQLFDMGSVASSRGPSIAEAYAVLGVNEDISDAELKRAYRRLMSQHHPDKLVSKGLPEEMIRIATEKTQEIKAAYEQIKEHRKK